MFHELLDPMLCQSQIISHLGVSRTQFWRMRKREGFPPPYRLSAGVQRWRRSDLIAWLQSRAGEP